MKKIVLLPFLLFVVAVCNNAKSKINMKNLYFIETTAGNITISLYDETPVHKANFEKLCHEKQYDGVIFHRVIKDFMIQGGDVTSKNPEVNKQYGSGDVGYTLEAEIYPDKFIHKKGALAAARTGDNINPERRSSGCQFYIVEGKKCDSIMLDQVEMQINQQKLQTYGNQLYTKLHEEAVKSNNTFNHEEAVKNINDSIRTNLSSIATFKYTPEQRKVYETIGGTPHLDGGYTVFGEVVDGLEIMESIAKSKTLPGDRPEQDIIIKSIKKL